MWCKQSPDVVVVSDHVWGTVMWFSEMWRRASCGVSLLRCRSSDNVPGGPAAHTYQSLWSERVRGDRHGNPAAQTQRLFVLTAVTSRVSAFSVRLSFKPGRGTSGSVTCLETGAGLKCICLWCRTGSWMLLSSAQLNRTCSSRWT